MMLGDLKNAVVLLGLIALVASAIALALDAFRTSDAMTTGGYAQNATVDGLNAVQNTTSFLGTIGTIIAVVALVTIVISAFSVGAK